MDSPEGGESQTPCVCCDCRFFDCACHLDDYRQVAVSDGRREVVDDDARDEARDKDNNYLRHCGDGDSRCVYCCFSFAVSLVLRTFSKDAS